LKFIYYYFINDIEVEKKVFSKKSYLKTT